MEFVVHIMVVLSIYLMYGWVLYKIMLKLTRLFESNDDKLIVALPFLILTMPISYIVVAIIDNIVWRLGI